ncbi:MAG: hypothetical protein Q9220_002110 [cf. Caloplaca sp. 1 TL-2023]
MSPLPNSKLWNGSTTGFLQTQDGFINGGWWHDHHILEATGQGIELEEPKAWEGWWNEHIVGHDSRGLSDKVNPPKVDLVDLSVKQDDALTILLTGRGEDNFAHLIKRIVASKKLAFDMICLKPQAGPNNQTFTSTMNYKQALLQDLVYTFKDAEEIKVYEDRVKHTRAFREYFENMNKSLLNSPAPAPRKPITAEVIQVAETTTTLDPVTETAEIQRMINSHNTSIHNGSHPHSSPLKLKRTVFFTGYLLSAIDTSRLLSLVKLPPHLPESEVKNLANNIIITPRPCPPAILEKIGGIGRKQTWQVTGTGTYENRIWAAHVTPVPSSAPYHTDNPHPIVVLAVVKGSRPQDANRIQNWQPVPTDKQYVFQTEVGEKVQLRVEAEAADGEGAYESLFHSGNRSHKRPREFQGESYRPARGDENRRLNGPNFRGGGNQRGGGGRGGGINNPALGSGAGNYNTSGLGNGDGGLPYGK